MALKDKYKTLVDIASSCELVDMQIKENERFLIIEGIAPNGDVKNKLWDVYNQLDPNFICGDVILNITVSPHVVGNSVKVVTDTTSLNIRKGPGIEQPIIGKAAKGEVVMMISRGNSQWWLIRTKEGVEGYCYARYLKALD